VRKSDMSTYSEDLAAVRPTHITIIPRLANMMHDSVLAQLELGPDGDELAVAMHKQARACMACLSWHSEDTHNNGELGKPGAQAWAAALVMLVLLGLIACEHKAGGSPSLLGMHIPEHLHGRAPGMSRLG